MAPSKVNILTGYWNDAEDPDLPPLKNWKHLVSRHPSIADQNPLDYCWHLDVHRNVPPEAERKRVTDASQRPDSQSAEAKASAVPSNPPPPPSLRPVARAAGGRLLS